MSYIIFFEKVQLNCGKVNDILKRFWFFDDAPIYRRTSVALHKPRRSIHYLPPYSHLITHNQEGPSEFSGGFVTNVRSNLKQETLITAWSCLQQWISGNSIFQRRCLRPPFANVHWRYPQGSGSMIINFKSNSKNPKLSKNFFCRAE